MSRTGNRFVTLVMLFVLGLVVIANAMPGNTPVFAGASAEPGDGHVTESKSINPLDSLKRDLAIWSAVIFGGLVFILAKFAFKPIAKALDEREQQVADNIAGAERANQEAKELLVQYENKLSEAGGEVKAIVEAGKKEAERAGELIVAKAREAAEAERVRAAKEIESATDGALQELAARSADLAVSLAGKIIRRNLDADSHADLIHTAVSDFSKN